ncbi:MAG TPA: CsbD family protein [Pseudonocardiaceae bacterium]|nr:CsbD family protein [Pseudonocardiaceae bacterium]
MSTADKAKGKIKETLGSLTGSDDLRKEGQAQQCKGHHLAQAAEARAMAENDEREAELFEQEERLRQELLY